MVWPRTMRAIVSQPTAPIAANRTYGLPRPKSVMSAITRNRYGRELRTSTVRIIGAVRTSADVARNGAPGNADHGTHQGRKKTDRERDARPGERAYEQIATQPVGAEPMGAVQLRCDRDAGPVELVVSIGTERGADPCRKRNEQHRSASHHRGRVHPQTAPRIAPQAAGMHCLSHGARVGQASHGADPPSDCR